MIVDSVLLAEADAPTRMGLRLALARGRLAVVAEEADADGAVATAVTERPALALIAAELPGGGLRAARAIAERLPSTRIVVLSSRPGGEELVQAVLAGAAGYLGKDISSTRLPAALRGILAGEVALPRRHTGHLLDAIRGRDARRTRVSAHAGAAMTDREWEILQLLGEGRSTSEMARGLGISEVTARRHISSLLRKLGASDRAGAVTLLSRSGE